MEHPLGLTIVRRGDEPSDATFFRATGAVCSLPILTQAAGASGYLNAAADPDGRIRRVPLMVELNGRVYPALALAAVIADVAQHTGKIYVRALSQTLDDLVQIVFGVVHQQEVSRRGGSQRVSQRRPNITARTRNQDALSRIRRRRQRGVYLHVRIVS